ncbi:hypothetical protein [Cohnella soli]|uniref:Uncharacterized protein n=1 Tax=Cohnella soli TaxID=425005 RepID=A0ABW0HJY7_9BACL
MKRYIRVVNDEQLECCMRNQINVDVWFKGELELTLPIQCFDEETVIFKEASYLRANVELRVRGNYFVGF